MATTDATLTLLATETERILEALADARRWHAPLRLAVRCERCDAALTEVDDVAAGDEIIVRCARHEHGGFPPVLTLRVGRMGEGVRA